MDVHRSVLLPRTLARIDYSAVRSAAIFRCFSASMPAGIKRAIAGSRCSDHAFKAGAQVFQKCERADRHAYPCRSCLVGIGQHRWLFLGQAGRARRLEKRKIVEFVIVVVNDRVPFDLRMLFQPGADLIPAGSLGQIRNDIRIRDTPIAGAEQAGGVVAPIRNENDLCTWSGPPSS